MKIIFSLQDTVLQRTCFPSSAGHALPAGKRNETVRGCGGQSRTQAGFQSLAAGSAPHRNSECQRQALSRPGTPANPVHRAAKWGTARSRRAPGGHLRVLPPSAGGASAWFYFAWNHQKFRNKPCPFSCSFHLPPARHTLLPFKRPRRHFYCTSGHWKH